MKSLTTKPKTEIIEMQQEEVYRDPYPKYITKNDFEKITLACNNGRVKFLFSLLWNTGIRISEALSLRVCDYDPYTKSLKIKHLKSRKKLKRIVKLNFRFSPLFVMYCSVFTSKEELLFPFSRQNVHSMLKRTCEGLDLSFPNISVHNFRHGFAINFLRQGGQLPTLKSLLGHTDIRTTLKYAEMVGDYLQEEIDKIEF